MILHSDVVWPDMKVPQPGVLAKDSFQNKRFKLIPSMVEAPWVVQMAVRLGLLIFCVESGIRMCGSREKSQISNTTTYRIARGINDALSVNLISFFRISQCSSTPVLLGQKVVQRYFRGEGYIEMDVHIGSSATADNIVGVCRSYSKAFICNLGTFRFVACCAVLTLLILRMFAGEKKTIFTCLSLRLLFVYSFNRGTLFLLSLQAL